jgi:hypothetical protein
MVALGYVHADRLWQMEIDDMQNLSELFSGFEVINFSLD